MNMEAAIGTQHNRRDNRTGQFICLLAAVCIVTGAVSARAAAPKFATIPADVTYIDEKTSRPVTISGEFKFSEWPLIVDGKKTAIGMDVLLPKKAMPTWFRRKDTNTFAAAYFKFTGVVQFDFNRIPFGVTAENLLAFSMDLGRTEISDDDILDEKKVDPAPVTLLIGAATNIREIAVSSIQSIEFRAPKGYSHDFVGRYVEYSKRVKGSGGRVQVAAATFFGGPGDEAFLGGGFLADGTIVAAADLVAPDGLPPVPQIVIGTDPTADDAGVQIRRAPVVCRYSADMKTMKGITRFAWSTASIKSAKVSASGALVVCGDASPGFDSVMQAARKSGSTGDAAVSTGPFVARFSADAGALDWVVMFPGTKINTGFRSADEVHVETPDRSWIIGADGAVREGPKRIRDGIRSRGVFGVSPHDNATYYGGDYQSRTAFEPYRNPYLIRYDDTGKPKWTAWNWTGPMVGVYFRQVSDSAVRGIKFARNGDLLVIGWSDGGNTVFCNEPYDLEAMHNKYGFFSEMWGAGVSSFCHLLRMDAKTMEVTAATYFISYLPFKDRPNGGSVADIAQLDDDRWALVGGTALGLIETPDAWIKPWIRQYQEDPATAKPHGGSCFAMFDAKFKDLLFCSLTPGVRRSSLATRGKYVLLSGAAQQNAGTYTETSDAIQVAPVQRAYGGGKTDGYLMLIDTAAEMPR